MADPGEKQAHGATQHDAWETIQRSHAVANGCYVAAVNRIGLEQPVGGAGLARYEVSNHARTGHECRHNQAYWDGRWWLGLGPGASAHEPPPSLV